MHTMMHTWTRDELNPMAANSAVAAGLSAAGGGSGRGGGMQQHMLEKSWNQDGSGHDHFHCHQEQEHQQQLQDLLGFCGIKGSTPKQLKRKRLADSMEQEESEAELVLELGQMVSSSRGFQDARAGAGGSSNSGNSSILGLDRPSCNVLLQLGSMRDDSSAAMSIGEGVRQILDPAVVVDNLDNAVTDLGIGPPPNPNLIAPHGPTRECELRASTSLLGLRQCDIIMENLLEGQIQVPVVDEESTSARLVSSGAGYMPSLLMNSHKLPTIAPSGMTYMQVTSTQQQAEEVEEEEEEEGEQGEEEEEDQDVEQQEYPKSMRLSTSCGTTSTSGTSGHSERPRPKVCRFRGCSKGPRGASGLCIAHGGGRRCQKNGCNKGAEGRTVFCKAHGGGRRCQTLGCTKSAEGKTDYCIGHGGGRRCTHEGCSKAARGRSGLCIRHGGGKRCQIEGCTKSAEGYSGLCISHGGGRR
jgi:ribosomal protein L12E/L44/L45/RPP1/RPP2